MDTFSGMAYRVTRWHTHEEASARWGTVLYYSLDREDALAARRELEADLEDGNDMVWYTVVGRDGREIHEPYTDADREAEIPF